MDERTEHLLRDLAPQVLGALVRRWHQFDACEDATAEALTAAVAAWTTVGTPTDPRAWLITVANRRFIDHARAESARRGREEVVADGSSTVVRPFDDAPLVADVDDSLLLLFLCCHPAIPGPSQIALTLRSVGGLSTPEIARAFLLPTATVAQRIVRAKARIRETGSVFSMPEASEVADRLAAVEHTIYLIFTEGYAATVGDSLTRIDLSDEAIRLARLLHELLPADAEVAGLLALLLLTDARRDARVARDGSLLLLEEQDRSLWDRAMIDEGVALVTAALNGSRLGPYAIQAAIAAVHDEAPSVAETDWRQIVALYDLLGSVAPSPVVELNRAVAIGRVDGPAAALRIVEELLLDPLLGRGHRVFAVWARLLEELDDPRAAAAYASAAQRATNLAEKRYLERQVALLGSESRR